MLPAIAEGDGGRCTCHCEDGADDQVPVGRCRHGPSVELGGTNANGGDPHCH